jgi:hypothetical protein
MGYNMVFCLTVVGLEGMSMVFGIGRKDAQDMQEAPSAQRVPYKMASYEHDHEGKRFRSSRVVYSFWSAAKYTLVLSIMLWWLPMFGQMIAGYVGGRRAGGPWKGLAASILPVVAIFAVIEGFNSGVLPSHVFGVAIAPAAIGASLSGGLPFISQYIQFSSEYIGSFVDALAGASPYGINTYIITVAFAYVGGVLAEQNRREIEFNSGAMMSNTTVLVQDGGAPEMHARHADRGLAHMISSRLPWHRSDPNAVTAMPYVRRRRDEWAHAADMHFVDDEPRAPMLPQRTDQRQDYGGFSQASAPRRQHRSHPSHRGDPWQRSERRVKQHFSSAHRFSEPAAFERAQPQQTHHSQAPRYVAGDFKSVKKVKRAIDAEWGGKRTAAPAVHFEDDGPAEAESAPAPPQKKPHHQPSGGHWDTI